MKQILYISGPMTGMPGLNHKAFNRVEKRLCKLGFGVVNPAALDKGKLGLPWKECLARDVGAMLSTKNLSGIVLLKGYKQSRGAAVEIFIATTVLQIPLYRLTKKGKLKLYNPKKYLWSAIKLKHNPLKFLQEYY